MARFLCWQIQEQAFGGLDPDTAKLLEGFARGGRPGADAPRRLKPGTVLVCEYQASGTPSRSSREGTFGARPHTQACRPSRAPSPARPGVAHASLDCALVSIVWRKLRAIKRGFAEFERELIRARTGEGRKRPLRGPQGKGDRSPQARHARERGDDEDRRGDASGQPPAADRRLLCIFGARHGGWETEITSAIALLIECARSF